MVSDLLLFVAGLGCGLAGTAWLLAAIHDLRKKSRRSFLSRTLGPPAAILLSLMVVGIGAASWAALGSLTAETFLITYAYLLIFGLLIFPLSSWWANMAAGKSPTDGLDRWERIMLDAEMMLVYLALAYLALTAGNGFLRASSVAILLLAVVGNLVFFVVRSKLSPQATGIWKHLWYWSAAFDQDAAAQARTQQEKKHIKKLRKLVAWLIMADLLFASLSRLFRR